MSLVIDEILGKALSHDHPLEAVASDPASGETGQLILNTTDDAIKVYYASQWQTLHSLSAEVSSFVFEDSNQFVFEDGNTYIFEA